MTWNNHFKKPNGSVSFSKKLTNLNFLALFSAILFLSVVSCKKDKEESGIRVNLKNISNYDFTNINFEGTQFGDLKKGTESLYKSFDTVYQNLAYVKLYINGVEFVALPIDYDAPELTTGSCTYLIDVIHFDDRRLSLVTQIKK